MARRRNITPSIMLSRPVAGSAMALGLIVSSIASNSPAIAQQAPQANSAGNSDALYRAGSRAEAYSKQMGGIGIVILYGGANGLPPVEEVGEKFVKEFAARGVKARYFVVYDGAPGISMSYHIDNIAMGPFPPQVAAQNLRRAVKLRNGADSINRELRNR